MNWPSWTLGYLRILTYSWTLYRINFSQGELSTGSGQIQELAREGAQTCSFADSRGAQIPLLVLVLILVIMVKKAQVACKAWSVQK